MPTRQVGFFTSFWCQKQQEESYNRPEAAELINSKFVPVLADRDQYPDIDRMFTAASQVEREGVKSCMGTCECILLGCVEHEGGKCGNGVVVDVISVISV